MGICNASRIETNNVVNYSPSSNNNNKLNGSFDSISGTRINTPQTIIFANKMAKNKKNKKKIAEGELIDEIFKNNNENEENNINNNLYNNNNNNYISIITKKHNINNFYKINYNKILGYGLTSKVYLASKINNENNENENNFENEENNKENNNKEKHFAIKIINKNFYKNIKLLQNEILISLFLKHPNVVKTYEIFEDNENIYFVMEYIKGLTLGEFISNYKLNSKIIKNLLIQILNAILYFHNKIKICHRDLKSNNIMVILNKNKEIKIKIIDFGFSCYINNINKMKENLGTINYTAPEILQGISYNNKIDIWSVGIILLDMILGYNYYEKKYYEFKKNNNNENNDDKNDKYKFIKYAILNDEIDFDEIVGNNENLRELLKVLLNKNPKERIKIDNVLDYVDKI
jgi:serine/threonine protein kinase